LPRFSGVQIADLDKARIYEIPAFAVAQMTTTQRLTAKACAFRYGIHYRLLG
jgi:hypothetical protein